MIACIAAFELRSRRKVLRILSRECAFEHLPRAGDKVGFGQSDLNAWHVVECCYHFAGDPALESIPLVRIQLEPREVEPHLHLLVLEQYETRGWIST